MIMELLDTFYDIIQDFSSTEKTILQRVNSTFIRSWSSATTIGTYIDKRIVQNINETMGVHYNINMVVSDILVDFNLIAKTKEEIMAVHIPIILILSTFCQFMKNVFRISKSNLTLYVYLTDFKKTLSANESLAPFNVNTGYTEGGTTIVIYRKEELLKVLIHELTHYFGIDEINVPLDVEKRIRDHFRVTSSVYLREAITEFWACTINIAYYTILDIDLKRSNSRLFFRRRFVSNLIKETKFCEKQAKIIANYVEYCEGKPILEKTHIISYYILKYIMLYRWNDYICLYRDINNKQAFLNNLLSDLDKIREIICVKSNNRSKHHKTSLRMTSLDVLKKCGVKTI